MRKKSWAQKQSLAWELFLLENGYNADDARRLGGFFGAQDAFETADGTNRGARELNNFGGMMTKDGYIRYNTPRDYMAAKLSMMQRRFGDALNAQSIDEFAQILGDPARAGRNYLYYVTDEVGYDPHNQAWRNAQTRHMHNYINGMRSKVGMAPLNFAGDNRGRIQIVDDGLQLASPLPQNQAAPIAASLPQNVVQPPRVRTKQVNKILPEIQVYGTNKSLRVPEQRPTHQSLRLTFNDYLNYEMLRQAGMVDDDADLTNIFLLNGLNKPKYKGGKDAKTKRIVTTSGPVMPPVDIYVKPTDLAKQAAAPLERVADFIPYVGTIADWKEVFDGDIAKLPSAFLGTIGDAALPGLYRAFKAYRAANAALKASRSTGEAIINLNKTKKAGSSLAGNAGIVGSTTYLDILQDYKEHNTVPSLEGPLGGAILNAVLKH